MVGGPRIPSGQVLLRQNLVLVDHCTKLEEDLATSRQQITQKQQVGARGPGILSGRNLLLRRCCSSQDEVKYYSMSLICAFRSPQFKE